MKKVLVYGSQEFGVVIKALVTQCGYEFAGFIDDYNSGEEVLGGFDEVSGRYPPASYELAIAVGYNNLLARWKVFQKVRQYGYALPRLVHPQAYVHDLDKVDEGTFVMAGAVVDVNVRLGPLTVAWPGVVVNHDSCVAANTFLSPNCTVCGFVTIGESCFVGAGTTIVDHVNVPTESFLKAGSLYTSKSKFSKIEGLA
jgi:sugar O-acyltransferase (sialic acid O-acetyltransferase NeuD family)